MNFLVPLPATGQWMLAALAVSAAIFDIRYRRIPNWLNLSGLVLGLAVNAWWLGWHGFGRAGLGILLGFILYFPLFLLRARGAGDVKLLTAVGSIAGPGNCFAIFLLTALLGGVVAIVLLLAKGRLGRTLWNVRSILTDLVAFRPPYAGNPEFDVNHPESIRLPHGAVIAVGIFAFLTINRT